MPLAGTLALALAALAAVPARAQTVTTGAIVGVAVDTGGRRLPGVEVTLTHRAAGWQGMIVTDASGAYRSGGLTPGSYDLRAERLGFRPLVVLDVTVSPGSAVTLDLRLTPAEPPVTQVDTMAYVEGAAHASLARGTWDPGHELADLVDPLGRVPAIATLASVSSGGLGIDGLPDRLGAVGVDGIPRVAANNPGSSRTDLSALGIPFSSLDHAEIASGTDVEWPGFGGGLVSAFSARAPRDARLRGYGDFADGSLRGGMVVGGPLVRDTAWGQIGVDARRLRTQFASPWPNDSQANLAVTLARDSLRTDLSAYPSPVTEQTDVVTAFGRLDWQVASGQSVALRAAVTNLSSGNFDLGSGRQVGLGTSLDARDISASAALSSHLFSNLRAELSLSVDRSKRDYSAPVLPGTVIVSDGLSAGSDGAVPGSFERDATRASGALLFRAGPHDLKAGLEATWTSHDISYDPWSAGTYVFGSVGDLARRRGSFVQAVGGVPDASFTIRSVAGYLQDAWTPVSGLSVLFGLRFEGEVPSGTFTADTAWLRLTGLANQVIPRPKVRASPRFAFSWSAGPRREWLLRGDAGLFSEGLDPAVVAEVLSHDGSAQIRRGVGALGAWPGVPDSTVAPVTGPVLTFLNSGFEPPRTGRASLSVARELGAGTSLQVAGQYRHTGFLPQRSDLNLGTAPQMHDQYGRPVYGTLQQYGSMLVATPGSNRRFSDFDAVWALDPTGFSDYWGVTVSLERIREQGLSLWASYTYSRTTDNTPGILGSTPEQQLSPFPGVTGQADWRDGRSDLDVPHRAALGAEWSYGAVRLAGIVRYRSGAPFTPGFRDGVDANGDGASGNDPAYVSDTVKAAAAVIGKWACLRQQIGTLAARNSCRGPDVTSFDARLVVRLLTVGGLPAELVVDGLNLLTTDDGVVDRALYLVDPSRTITMNAAGTVVTVPLVANPNFGKLLVRRSPSATVRAGLRFSF
ncbi:MAG: carboxypeptidase regulatory-like domain-containing protein [Gemmatimonadales bacterium]|jgi:hypothetical protein